MDSNIIVNSPLSNDSIASPVEISGRARVFEGTVLFRLKDSFNRVLSRGFTISSLGAPGWGYYKGSLEFDNPQTPTGWLEVYSESAEDGSEIDLISLPVVFEDFKSPKIKVFFSNIKEDPEILECDKVYPIEREVAPSDNFIAVALEELFKGLTEEDIKAGFVDNLPEAAVKINSLEIIATSTLAVDFDQALQEGVAGSCRVLAIRAQISETLKQFPNISEVVISIEGETEEILQP
ncbi:GerMN domain-containing protein [Candidatus Falkowbacteria bacterium]|nr:GerMN domain-containing protein [Candidatus Falkowbacteria bacterium]